MERQYTRSVSPLLTRRRTGKSKLHKDRIEQLFKNLKDDVDILPKHGRGKVKKDGSRESSPKASLHKRDSSPKLINIKREKSVEPQSRTNMQAPSYIKPSARPVARALTRIKHERTKSLPVSLESRNRLKKDSAVDSKRSQSAGRKSVTDTKISFLTPEKCSTESTREVIRVDSSKKDAKSSESCPPVKKGKKASKSLMQLEAGHKQSDSVQPTSQAKTSVKEDIGVNNIVLADIVKKKRMGRSKKMGETSGEKLEPASLDKGKVPLVLDATYSKLDTKTALSVPAGTADMQKKKKKTARKRPETQTLVSKDIDSAVTVSSDSLKEVSKSQPDTKSANQPATTLLIPHETPVENILPSATDKICMPQVIVHLDECKQEKFCPCPANNRLEPSTPKSKSKKTQKNLKDVSTKSRSPKMKQARKILKKSVGSSVSKKPSLSKKDQTSLKIKNTEAIETVEYSQQDSTIIPIVQQFESQQPVAVSGEEVIDNTISGGICEPTKATQTDLDNLTSSDCSSAFSSGNLTKKKARKSLKSSNVLVTHTKHISDVTISSKEKSTSKRKKHKQLEPEGHLSTEIPINTEKQTCQTLATEKFSTLLQTPDQKSNRKKMPKKTVVSQKKYLDSEMQNDLKQEMVRKKIGKYQRQMITNIKKGSSFYKPHLSKVIEPNIATQTDILHNETSLEQEKKTTKKVFKSQDQSDIREFLTKKNIKSKKRSLSADLSGSNGRKKKAKLHTTDKNLLHSQTLPFQDNTVQPADTKFSEELDTDNTECKLSESKATCINEKPIAQVKSDLAKKSKKGQRKKTFTSEPKFVDESWNKANDFTEEYSEQYVFPSDESEISFNSFSFASLPNLVIHCSSVDQQSQDNHNRSVSLTNKSLAEHSVQSQNPSVEQFGKKLKKKTRPKKAGFPAKLSLKKAVVSKKRKPCIKLDTAKSSSEAVDSNKAVQTTLARVGKKKKEKMPTVIESISHISTNLQSDDTKHIYDADLNQDKDTVAMIQDAEIGSATYEKKDDTIFGLDEELHGEPLTIPFLKDCSLKDNSSIASGTTDSSISSGKHRIKRRKKRGPWMKAISRIKKRGQRKNKVHGLSHPRGFVNDESDIVNDVIVEENAIDSCSVSSLSTISCISEVSSLKGIKQMIPEENTLITLQNKTMSVTNNAEKHSENIAKVVHVELNEINLASSQKESDQVLHSFQDAECAHADKVLASVTAHVKKKNELTGSDSSVSIDSCTNSTLSSKSDAMIKRKKRKNSGPWMKKMTVLPRKGISSGKKSVANKESLKQCVTIQPPTSHTGTKKASLTGSIMLQGEHTESAVVCSTGKAESIGPISISETDEHFDKKQSSGGPKTGFAASTNLHKTSMSDEDDPFFRSHSCQLQTSTESFLKFLPVQDVRVSSCKADSNETKPENTDIPFNDVGWKKPKGLNDSSSSTDTASSADAFDDMFDDKNQEGNVTHHVETFIEGPLGINNEESSDIGKRTDCTNMSRVVDSTVEHYASPTYDSHKPLYNTGKQRIVGRRSLPRKIVIDNVKSTVVSNKQHKHSDDALITDEKFITSGGQMQKPVAMLGLDTFPSNYFNSFGKPLQKTTARKSFSRRGRKRHKWTRKPKKTIKHILPGLTTFFPLETMDGSVIMPTNEVTSHVAKKPIFPKKRKYRRKKGTARKSFKNFDPMDFLFPDEDDDMEMSHGFRSSYRSEKHWSGASSQRFHLRQKVSRSPLEIIAMKQRLEDERVDLAEKKKKKRGPRKSFLSPVIKKRRIDELAEKCKPCSVVLTDFVKQLGISCGNEDTETVHDDSFTPDSFNISFDDGKLDSFTSIKTPKENTSSDNETVPEISPPKIVSDPASLDSKSSPNTANTIVALSSSHNVKDDSFEESYVKFITNKEKPTLPTPKKRRKLLCPKPVRRIAPKVCVPSATSNDSVSTSIEHVSSDNALPYSTSPHFVPTEFCKSSFISEAPIVDVLPYMVGNMESASQSSNEKQFICEIYKCKCCDFSTKTRKVICQHIHMHHSTALHCAYCNSVLKSYINAKIHHEKCHMGREFHLVKFTEFDESQYYETQIDPVLPPAKKFSCKYCSFVSYDPEKIKLHVHSHVSVPLRCGYCGTISECLTVAQLHHGEKHYQRDFHLIKLANLKETAHYVTQLESALENLEPAESINTDEKKECEIANVESSVSSHDSANMSTLTPTVVVSVVVSGNVEIQTKSSVSSECLENRNLRNRYHCNYCSYSSNYMENIMLHGSEIHRIDTKYICSMCNVEFQRDRSKISEHFLVNHTEQPVVYKKVPPFYDLEELNITPGPNESATDKGNIFDKMQDIFGHSDVSDSDGYDISHSQTPTKKGKHDKLKTKTSAEADSTTTMLEYDGRIAKSDGEEDGSSCSSTKKAQKEVVSSDTGEGSVSSNQLDDDQLYGSERIDTEHDAKLDSVQQLETASPAPQQTEVKALEQESVLDDLKHSDQHSKCEDPSTTVSKASAVQINDAIVTDTLGKSCSKDSNTSFNDDSDGDSDQDVSYSLYLDSDDDDETKSDVQEEVDNMSVCSLSLSAGNNASEQKICNIKDKTESVEQGVELVSATACTDATESASNLQPAKHVNMREIHEDSDPECIVLYDRLKYVKEHVKNVEVSASDKQSKDKITNRVEDDDQALHECEVSKVDEVEAIALQDESESSLEKSSTESSEKTPLQQKGEDTLELSQLSDQVKLKELADETHECHDSDDITKVDLMNSSDEIPSSEVAMEIDKVDDTMPDKLTHNTVVDSDSSETGTVLDAVTIESTRPLATTEEAPNLISNEVSTTAAAGDLVAPSVDESMVQHCSIVLPNDETQLELNVSSRVPEEFMAGANVKAVIDLDDSHLETGGQEEQQESIQDDDDSDNLVLKIVDVKSLQHEHDTEAALEMCIVPDDENGKEQQLETEVLVDNQKGDENALFDDADGNIAVTYKCLKCNIHTPKLEGVVYHLEATHGIIESLKCPYCGLAKGSRELQIYSHIKQYHAAYPPKVTVDMSARSMEIIDRITIPLEEETKKFKSTSLMEKDIYMCIKCHTHMPSLDYTFEHLEEKHNDVFVYVCPYCKRFKAKEENLVLKHIRGVHNRPESTANVSLAIEENLFVRVPHFSKAHFSSEKKPIHSKWKQQDSPSASPKPHEVKAVNIDTPSQKSVQQKVLPSTMPVEKPVNIMGQRQPPPIAYQGPAPFPFRFTRFQANMMKTLTGQGSSSSSVSAATRLPTAPPPLIRFSPPGIPTNYIIGPPEQNIAQTKPAGVQPIQPKLKDISMLASPNSTDGGSPAISPNQVSSAINLVTLSPEKQLITSMNTASMQRRESPGVNPSNDDAEPKSVATMSFRMTDRLHRCTDRLHRMHAQNKKQETMSVESASSRAVLKVPTPGIRRPTTQSPSTGADSPALSDSQSSRASTPLDLSRTPKPSDKASDIEQDDDLPPDAFQIFNLKPTLQAEAKSPTAFQSPPSYHEALGYQMQGQVSSQYRNQSPYSHFTHSSPGFMHAASFMTEGRQPSPHAQIKGPQLQKQTIAGMPSVFRCPYCPAKIPLLQREVAEHTTKFHKGCKVLYIPF